jgi:hypothetical protein
MRRGGARALAAMLVLAMLLTGCGRFRNLRLSMPGFFGMQRASANLWVEPGMPAATRADLQYAFLLARRRIEAFYGPLRSSPQVVACITEARARAFGLRGARAHTVAGRTILLGPRGLAAPILTHEWAHAELYARLGRRGLTGIAGVPRWFDEGLACVISEEPAHSEANWQEIQRRRLPTPSLNEMRTFPQMLEAARRYGDIRRDSTMSHHVVYTTAAHEVRGWLASAGRGGVLQLISAMNAGEPFASTYGRLGGETATPR